MAQTSCKWQHSDVPAVSFAKQALCPVLSDKVSGSHLKNLAENVIVGTTEVHLSCKLKSELMLIGQKGNMN